MTARCLAAVAALAGCSGDSIVPMKVSWSVLGASQVDLGGNTIDIFVEFEFPEHDEASPEVTRLFDELVPVVGSPTTKAVVSKVPVVNPRAAFAYRGTLVQWSREWVLSISHPLVRTIDNAVAIGPSAFEMAFTPHLSTSYGFAIRWSPSHEGAVTSAALTSPGLFTSDAVRDAPDDGLIEILDQRLVGNGDDLDVIVDRRISGTAADGDIGWGVRYRSRLLVTNF